MRKSNYDKIPKITIPGTHDCVIGWNSIIEVLRDQLDDFGELVIECYHGYDERALQLALLEVMPDALLINAAEAFKSHEAIDELTQRDVTDDRIFGAITRFTIEDYFDQDKLTHIEKQIDQTESKCIVVYGVGASHLINDPSVFAYVDMARWELQQRMRRYEIGNLGVSNVELEIARKYKRAYFVDWRICDRVKKETFDQWDYVIDANSFEQAKMISKSSFDQACYQTMTRPFRLVPLFDPGPWGGQWMREVCDLDDGPENYAWCFDCVPEENSVLFEFNNIVFEFPSINLVFFQPRKLLGEAVYSRFGAEFPIRFDFLDTMQGGNLSLQVHPLTEFIQTHFGMHYTQDESYYILDAADDAVVYLGLRDEVDSKLMMKELREAQAPGGNFDAGKHVAHWPAKKHDHFLIPAGTVHCSGKNSMVLEVSATPYIFTFKLWDWGRLGMDGQPRPINIDRGEKSIQWDRNATWTKENLINQFVAIDEGDGWRSEKTGLHETEFIETIRHWFTKPVAHHTNGNLNVINLVQGDEVIVESPTGAFEPFVVHYAETFVIPAAVGAYTIKPLNIPEGHTCATLKAYVKY